MLSFIKKLFGIAPAAPVVVEAPYKVEAPVVAVEEPAIIAAPAKKPRAKKAPKA